MMNIQILNPSLINLVIVKKLSWSTDCKVNSFMTYLIMSKYLLLSISTPQWKGKIWLSFLYSTWFWILLWPSRNFKTFCVGLEFGRGKGEEEVDSWILLQSNKMLSLVLCVTVKWTLKILTVCVYFG